MEFGEHSRLQRRVEQVSGSQRQSDERRGFAARQFK